MVRKHEAERDKSLGMVSAVVSCSTPSETLNTCLEMSMLLHGFTNVFTTEKHEPALQSTAQASVGAGNIGQGGVFPQIERM